MKRLIYLCLTCLLLGSATLRAQEQGKAEKVDSIELTGRLVDSFTRETVDSVWVELYSMPDSVLVDTFYNLREQMVKMYGWEYPIEGFQSKVPQHGKYMIYAAKKGYKPFFHTFDIPRRRYNKKVREWDLDELLLQKAGTSFLDTDLDEITVRATRVKMVMNGDTVVYNADAFQLSEGSMLDALVQQLPGVEIRKGGEIYVNGNKVEELLVNGKDFFNGDAKMALENLPAYVVQNIKAYQREAKHAYLDKHHDATKKKDPWVLDVSLKREYAQGWLGNVEAGYGWDDRYMARIFGIRYTDHSRITLFANANNTNDFSTPGSETSWTNSSAPTSEIRTLTGGFDLNVDDKITKTEFNTSINASRTTTDSETEESSQTFLAGGDVWRRSRNISTSNSGSLSWSGRVDFRKKELFANISAGLNYRHGNSNGTQRSATFSQDPLDSHRGASLDSIFAPIGSNRLNAFLTNRSEDLTHSTNQSFSPNLSGMAYTVAPWNGESIFLQFNENYNTSQDKNYSHYDLRQQGEAQDFRNRYTESPARSNSLGLRLQHNFYSYKDIFAIGMEYSYSNDYNNGKRNLYRLDDYTEWGAGANRKLGMLPSTQDSLQLCIDAANSYYSISRNKSHYADLSMSGGGEWGYYYLTTGFERKKERTEDTRQGIERDLSKRFMLWNVSAAAEIKNVSLSMNYRQSSPGLSQLLDVRDDSNPLHVSLGNPNLSNTYNVNGNLDYHHNSEEKQSSWNIGITVHEGSAIGLAQTYDRQTGVYTTQPRNVNGNWGGGMNGYVSLPLDKQKLLTLNSGTYLNYDRSVDFSSDDPAVLDPSNPNIDFPLSKVHNYNASEWMSIEFKKDEYAVSANVNANYSHVNGDRPDFKTINTIDFSYGVSGRLGFKHGYHLDMDLTMHSRRGYDDKTMNDDNLVLNMALSKAFFKNRCFVLKLTGHDILQQLDNVRRNLNAQGRTETWYNTQPSYVLLTASYRLDMKPKKK